MKETSIAKQPVYPPSTKVQHILTSRENDWCLAVAKLSHILLKFDGTFEVCSVDSRGQPQLLWVSSSVSVSVDPRSLRFKYFFSASISLQFHVLCTVV